MSPGCQSFLADIASEKTGLRHLDGIVGEAVKAFESDRKWITARELTAIKRAIKAKRKTIKEMANKSIPIANDKQKQPKLF